MCYSDHNEDIRTKGSCDYCRGVELEAESAPKREVKDRVLCAIWAFESYCMKNPDAKMQSKEENLVDLICDLIHMAHSVGLDAARIIARVDMYLLEE